MNHTESDPEKPAGWGDDMRVRNSVLALLTFAGVIAIFHSQIATAQAPAPRATPAARPAARAMVHGNLLQVMRGILFPNSNVIFAAQNQDPATVKPEGEPTMATNPLAGTYGGWQAVENSSLALAEAANLLTIPGRRCSNGRLAPVQNADWAKFVQGLRDAGMAAYKAAQSKSQDAIVDVSDQVTTACANCHNVYREKTDAQGGMAARCAK
jgi:hypothetical protein